MFNVYKLNTDYKILKICWKMNKLIQNIITFGSPKCDFSVIHTILGFSLNMFIEVVMLVVCSSFLGVRVDNGVIGLV